MPSYSSVFYNKAIYKEKDNQRFYFFKVFLIQYKMKHGIFDNSETI